MKIVLNTLACNWLNSDLTFSTVMDNVRFSSLMIDNSSTSLADIFCSSSYWNKVTVHSRGKETIIIATMSLQFRYCKETCQVSTFYIPWPPCYWCRAELPQSEQHVWSQTLRVNQLQILIKSTGKQQLNCKTFILKSYYDHIFTSWIFRCIT